MQKLNLDVSGLSDLRENDQYPPLKVEDYENDSYKVGMYAFYDTESNRFDTPFFCQSDMFAGRHYKMVTDQEGTMLNKFKSKFNVHRLGFYDLQTGEFFPMNQEIINGHSVVQNEKKEN